MTYHSFLEHRVLAIDAVELIVLIPAPHTTAQHKVQSEPPPHRQTPTPAHAAAYQWSRDTLDRSAAQPYSRFAMCQFTMRSSRSPQPSALPALPAPLGVESAAVAAPGVVVVEVVVVVVEAAEETVVEAPEGVGVEVEVEEAEAEEEEEEEEEEAAVPTNSFCAKR
jgi:hypothetical protein